MGKEIVYCGTHKDNQGGKDEIFEAKSQLVKYVSYDLKNLIHRLKLRGYNPKKNYFIWMYFPVIVFDGKLFESIVKKDGNIELFERKHILFETSYCPKYIHEFNDKEILDLNYIIDVITPDYLPQYLKIIRNDCEKTINLIRTLYDEIKDYEKIDFGLP
jgi:hypothetical protein